MKELIIPCLTLIGSLCFVAASVLTILEKMR